MKTVFRMMALLLSFGILQSCSDDDKKMNVDFSCNGKAITHFDIKQMICHLLGIAAAVLDGKFRDKELKFLYLLFDPSKINIPDEKKKEMIISIYRQTCAECAMIDFKKLFEIIYAFLAKNKSDGFESGFVFRLCNHENFCNEVK